MRRAARLSASLLGAGYGIPGSAQGEVRRDPEDAGVRGASNCPLAAAEQAAGAAGDRPVGGEVDPDEKIAGAADVEAEALASDPEDPSRRRTQRLDQGLGVANRV